MPERTAVPAAAPAATGRRRWAVLAVLCLSLLPVGLDNTALHVAVPALTADLPADTTQVLWVLDAYSLVMAGLLVPAGAVADRVGHKRCLLAGLVLFFAGSAAAALSTSPGALIAARAGMGVGGALIMPTSLALLRQVFHERKERVFAIGLWTAVGSVGSALGPAVGGTLVQSFWWGAVFLMNLPVLALVCATAVRLVPRHREVTPTPFDARGALVVALSLFGLVHAMKEMAHSGVRPAPCAVLLLAAVGLCWFVRRQARHPHPVLDLTLFRNRGFAVAVTCVLFAVIAVSGLEVLFAQYFQYVLGLGPQEAGVRMMPLALATMLGSLAGGAIVGRVGISRSLRAGLTVAVLACAPLTLVGGADRPVVFALCFLGMGLGFQVAVNVASETALSSVPSDRAGGAAAIDATAFELGTALGVAIPGVIAGALYTATLDDTPGLAPGILDRARNSAAAAHEAAGRLPAADAALLKEAAQRAFLTGLRSVVVLALVLLTLCLLLTYIHRRTPRARRTTPR
ncbi:MFS transporter [Streptomyces sp. CT34]|uniref:MFS transporter n=1 Tax=Streptomyces sp. CT34 TaxID=1553907 RepID=UPI00068B050A|nr:MFS transporter [Streptomyces sp. CT34]